MNTEDYVGGSADGRADETSMFSANLDYAFRSNVLVTGSLSNMERTSTTAGIGFTQNVVGINVTVGM